MIRWNLAFRLEVKAEGENDAALLERWKRVEEALNDASIHGDTSLLTDVLETLEQLVAIRRRAAACVPRDAGDEQEDPNVE